jgi:hypothetical protein
MSNVYEIPIVKAKGQFVRVDTSKDKLPDDVYKYALFLGLKAIVNRGTAAVNPKFYPNQEALEAAAIRIAEEQVELAYNGKTRIVGMSGVKTKGAARKDPVHIEAVRLAKIYGKAQTKALHPEIKISNVTAKAWTETAERYILSDPDMWYRLAQESLAKAAIEPIKGLDFAPEMDPEKVAEDLKKKEAAKLKKDEAAAKKAAKETKAAKKPAKSVIGKSKAKSAPEADLA